MSNVNRIDGPNREDETPDTFNVESGGASASSSNKRTTTPDVFDGVGGDDDNRVVQEGTDEFDNPIVNGVPVGDIYGEGNISTNYQYQVEVRSNIVGASVLLNGDPLQLLTPNKFLITLADVIQSGQSIVTVFKEGYTSNERYILSVVENPDYTAELPSGDDRTINPRDILTGTSPFKVNVRYFIGDEEQELLVDDGLFSINLPFNLTQIIETVPPKINSSLSIILSGNVNSSFVKIGDASNVNLVEGTNNFNIVPNGTQIIIASTDIQENRIVEILYNNEILTANPGESLSLSLNIVDDLSISVKTEEVIQTIIPAIRVDTQKQRKYNINSNSPVPIYFTKTSNVNKIKVYIANQLFEYDLDGANNVLSIPSSAFTRGIGAYTVYLVPVSNEGEGNSVEIVINVIDEVYVGIPDIRDITYPKFTRGADYKGLDVPFTIQWASVNTDFVRISKPNTDKFIQVPSTGTANLNFKDWVGLDGTEDSEGQNGINVVLTLTPYNDSGIERIEGKTEIINLEVDVSNLTIPKSTAVNRIVESFISQFDETLYEEETSKFLTHQLHLDDGVNIPISTWEGDGDSLVVKLYEPLPTDTLLNSQIWISKPQSTTILETITLTDVIDEVCQPLKGPNFSLMPDNSVGNRIFDELINSGSTTSNDLAKKYLFDKGIDTKNLNINYVDNTGYLFENFVNFSSATERTINFVYKIKLLEGYVEQYNNNFEDPELLENTGSLTINGFEVFRGGAIVGAVYEESIQTSYGKRKEVSKSLTNINNLLNSFDGFESFLYESTDSLAYPKELYTSPNSQTTQILKDSNSAEVHGWHELILNSSQKFDKLNPNYLVNNIPEFIKEDRENEDFILFLDMIGQHFDIIWSYINTLKGIRKRDERIDVGIPNDLIWAMLNSMGWEGRRAFNSQNLWEYSLGKNIDGTPKYGMSLKDANNSVWRRILNNLPYLLKHKGTSRSLKAILACYGVPQSILSIMEFGGPQDPTTGESTKYTFEDRSASILLKSGSTVIVPWKEIPDTSQYPYGIEFRIKPDEISTYTLLEAEQFKLNVVPTGTGSFVNLKFSISDVPNIVSFDEPFPLSTEHYSNILLNKFDLPGSTQYEILLNTHDGERTITYVSMSLISSAAPWTSGSLIQFGNGYNGALDEVRLWKEPLDSSKFEIHSSFPDSIVGNSITASTEDLMFRMDFELIKDRTKTENFGIKNVAISSIYGEPFGSASNFYSSSEFPFQYVPYERTVTALVPSVGFSYANKIRFEDQELVGDLSHRVRATQKAFDKAPVDSNRLGLFLSPTRELNLDIIKSLGEFSIDNLIGDPEDYYKDSYRGLEDLRTYYFQRLNRNIYEYINLVRYIDKSLFDVLGDLVPVRSKVSKGLLIEPHILERSKISWSKPESNLSNNKGEINIQDTQKIQLDYSVQTAELDGSKEYTLDGKYNVFQADITDTSDIELIGTPAFFLAEVDYNVDELLEGTTPFFSADIDVPKGETLTGEVDSTTYIQVGMDENSLSNLGFGLYGKNGAVIWKRYDIFGNVTSSRNNVFLVEEEKTTKVRTQVSGWPTIGSVPGEQVSFQFLPVSSSLFSISILPFNNTLTPSGDVVNVTPLNGYFKTHYKFVSNLSEGLKRSFYKGSVQNSETTPDGLSPVETFTTNPNILRVADTGRASGEPILIVE